VGRLVALWRSEDYAGLRTQSLLSLHETSLPEAAYMGGLSLLAEDKLTAGSIELSRLADAYPTQPLGWHARLSLAGTLATGAPAAAIPQFDLLLADTPPANIGLVATRDRARAYVRLGQLPAAADSLAAGMPDDLGTLTAAVEQARRWRSPAAAKWLALVPGLGHLYAGSPRQALSAFVVNGVFASGIAYSAHRRSWGLTGVLGFFGAGFYVGNLYGAADAARRHNRAVIRSIDRRLDAAGWQTPPPAMPEPEWAPSCAPPGM
jgi:hypothetical protein